jgi:hypothetical protein
MKIGIDIHGTIDWDPEFWRQTIPFLIALGHQIHIVSGPEEEKIVKRLEELGVDYKPLYIESVADYLKEKGVTHWYDKNNEFWTDDDSWWRSKATICRERKIDILIDDQWQYLKPDIAPDMKFILYQKGRFVCAPKT